ncbi:MAG: hypothetical protein KGJ07_09685 [Patescibacteria group bacterium]|nr:hypothetical protein [Patescibacteria group bacterium]
MKNSNQISLEQWNELTENKKEILRKWAVQRGYELDLIPGSTGTFDPACEYAALLSQVQMIEFLKSRKISLSDNEGKNRLWKKVKGAINIAERG